MSILWLLTRKKISIFFGKLKKIENFKKDISNNINRINYITISEAKMSKANIYEEEYILINPKKSSKSNKKRLNKYRSYQAEADDAVYQELLNESRCCVNMFCGSGKSLVMRKCKSAQNLKLLVYVFPTLGLIKQFCKEYFTEIGDQSPFCISSESGATTDPVLIRAELAKTSNKIICVTYQSYQVLIDNLQDGQKINLAIYDEAHHCVGDITQALVFDITSNPCIKQLFFTATPQDKNGIIMIGENAHCGKTVFKFSYLDGLNNGYLNPFEVRIDLYTENTKRSLYESIARAILATGNNRVLTFHADVNTDRDNSVIKFVNEAKFISIFRNINENEYPHLVNKYKTITMVKLDATDSAKSIKIDENETVSKRDIILANFDKTPDDDIYIISSCETIGEGIDTKNANMCVFADPKSSYVRIIQNIGRIIRLQSKTSTVLIPCWVDREKYADCQDDKEKRDEVIRREMNANGDFNGILNVLSALKQADEDIYNMCINYPKQFMREETRKHLKRYNYQLLEDQSGDLRDTLGYFGLNIQDEDTSADNSDTDSYEDDDNDDEDEEEELLQQVAKKNNICIEVHTSSLDNPVIKYNEDCDTIIRIYKNDNEDSSESESSETETDSSKIETESSNEGQYSKNE